jgi:hypothetical protein
MAAAAGVAKLADARDLKSRDPQGSCGFDSHPRHQRNFDRASSPARNPYWQATGRELETALFVRRPFTKCSDAAEFLKQRVADAMAGKIPLAKGVTYDDLAELIINDYRNNGRKSIWSLEHVRLPKLADVFAGTKALDITTTAVERYTTLRLKDKAAPATVNRELAALKRMFRLGMRQGMVSTMPHIALLTENNTRKGFFELDQFKLLLKYLPEDYHALYEVAYHRLADPVGAADAPVAAR